MLYSQKVWKYKHKIKCNLPNKKEKILEIKKSKTGKMHMTNWMK